MTVRPAPSLIWKVTLEASWLTLTVAEPTELVVNEVLAPPDAGGLASLLMAAVRFTLNEAPVLGIVTATPPAVLSPTESVKLTS